MPKVKYIFLFVIVCIVHKSSSKPATQPTNELTQGRGIGSTLWGWVSYPFSWWVSDAEPLPVNDQLIASTTYGPYDYIEIGKHNVTVWCNDQICTTMKCNKDGCRNNTCNIYDTKTTGECREYTTVIDPEDQMSPQPITTSKPLQIILQTESPIEVSEVAPSMLPEDESNPSGATDSHQQDIELPLQLEAVLSSTVNTTPGKI